MFTSLSSMTPAHLTLYFFFFNDTATTEIYTLSLHDALPIWRGEVLVALDVSGTGRIHRLHPHDPSWQNRSEETRLNSSHLVISYAVFCLKKKKQTSSKIRRHSHTQVTLMQHCLHSTTRAMCN